jgi:hypothetical protein
VRAEEKNGEFLSGFCKCSPNGVLEPLKTFSKSYCTINPFKYFLSCTFCENKTGFVKCLSCFPKPQVSNISNRPEECSK